MPLQEEKGRKRIQHIIRADAMQWCVAWLKPENWAEKKRTRAR
jgi:hypothetical protein